VAGGVWVDTGLIIDIVVWCNGLQPTLKLVGLLKENVGHADNDVMVTVFCELHPFTKLVVTRVYTPGGKAPLNILMVLFDVAIGTPPGNGFNGLYQSC
jgi:hypothetical protein